MTSVDTSSRTAIVEWSASQGAERYIIEYGPVVDSVPAISIATDAPVTHVVLRDLPGALLAVRVKAGNTHGVSGPSNQLLVQIPAFNDVTEALFFGSGPYGTGLFAAPGATDFFAVGADPAHAGGGVMLGWRVGTIKVRVDEALTDPQLNNLRRVLTQIVDVTAGDVRSEIVERSSNLAVEFWHGELRVFVREDIGSLCRNNAPNVLGCALQFLQAGGEIGAALVFVKPHVGPDVIGHEIGHAILGLHHVIGITQPALPVMTPSLGWTDVGLTSLEMDAIRTVYRAGLRYGATKAEFEARGLIGNR